METNPILIMLINMTIVFGVLISLGVLMRIIYLIDPTKKKPVKVEAAPAPAAAPAAAPVAAPVANDDAIVAAITGAIMAMGYSSNQIASIRPAVAQSWKMEGRLSGLR